MFLIGFLAVVAVLSLGCLSYLRRRWGLETLGQAATESASRLVSSPVHTPAAVRRRLVRALVRQRVIMPSGTVLAARHLHLRISDEDVDRLVPHGDLDDLAADAADTYLRHAQRNGWKVDRAPSVSVAVDPTLRSGWVPAARICAEAPRDVDGYGEAGAPAVEPYPYDLDTPSARDDVDPTSAPADEVADREPTRALAAVSRDATAVTRLRPDRPDAVLRLVPVDGGTSLTVTSDPVRPGPVLVGRDPASDLLLDDPAVSRRHAALFGSAAGWTLVDEHSSNGTYVGGNRLTPGVRHDLEEGAVVSFGSRRQAYRVTVERPGAATPAAAAPIPRTGQLATAASASTMP